ncbi:heterotrimeric G protein alpha subunit C [Mycena pura]|uniref:Heterotrimeric G protein alpha subunit C n=1 Tax=Mycena pura TaxID=153505 RepID=A0AAD6Y1K8_9AGAR|nr:heterotrimeric G protein alpha subunit C [Mycena pura]
MELLNSPDEKTSNIACLIIDQLTLHNPTALEIRRIKSQQLALKERLQKAAKILLLGTGDSGKTTILKQMKIIHQGGFDEHERAAYRITIYKNLLDCVATLARVVRRVGVGSLPEQVWEHAETHAVLTPALADAVRHICHVPVVEQVADEHPTEFYLIDNAGLFSSIHRIADPAYVPNEEDILHARNRTIGITETRFRTGELPIHLFDVGGARSERKKWIHCFESVTSIIFCAALSDYDQVLEEARSANRMRESLVLFESVINSRWFLRTTVILFLNKIDVFKKKLPKIPLGRYFPEYTSGNDLQKAAKFILWRFMQENRARLAVYPHLTQATNTKNIRLVHGAVKETIVQNALKDELNNTGSVHATLKEKIKRNTLKYTQIL